MATDNDDFREVEPDNIRNPPPYREGRAQVVTPDTVRQGPSGLRVLIVLLSSLFMTMILWAVGGMFHWW